MKYIFKKIYGLIKQYRIKKTIKRNRIESALAMSNEFQEILKQSNMLDSMMDDVKKISIPLCATYDSLPKNLIQSMFEISKTIIDELDKFDEKYSEQKIKSAAKCLLEWRDELKFSGKWVDRYIKLIPLELYKDIKTKNQIRYDILNHIMENYNEDEEPWVRKDKVRGIPVGGIGRDDRPIGERFRSASLHDWDED